MLSDVRVLLLEDDPLWINSVRMVLEPHVASFQAAETLDQAKAMIVRGYFNLLVVDVSLVLNDADDETGIVFLDWLCAEELHEGIQYVVCSGYGDTDRVRRLFRDYAVADYIDKSNFSDNGGGHFLETMENAMQAFGLARTLDLEIRGDRDLSVLWSAFNWPTREDEDALRAELRDLLARLFPRADHLFIEEMPTGQSGAGVLKVTPSYEGRVASPLVVKFGKRDKINDERKAYRDYVNGFAGNQSATQLEGVSGRAMGAIAYSLIGTELEAVTSFARFYQRNDVETICKALEHVFQVCCRRWYDSREQGRRQRDLVKLYTDALHIKWDEVWAGAGNADPDLTSATVAFRGIHGVYPNPKIWLEQREEQIYLPVWLCVTHGDLNENNILVTTDAHCWLIDFYRTGWHHILTDVVELETAIKFNLVDGDLAQHHRLETRLLQQIRMDELDLPGETDPLYKPMAVLAQLRRIADIFTGIDKDMREYNTGLLLATLNLLSLPSMADKADRILLSAALLCDWLDASAD